MRRAGRISLVSVLAVAALAMVVVVLLFSKQGISTVGSQFMDALARGDVDKLTDLTYLGKETPEEIHKDWEFATQVSGRHYNFSWRITGELVVDATTGSVKLSVQRNLGPGSYDENYALPMIKIGDKWKVDVAGINRDMYPGIPRGRS